MTKWDSDVFGGPGLGIQARRTPEIFLGVERILDPQTKFSFNLTYGRPKGYLSDPYRIIGLTETLFAGQPEEVDAVYPYSENRPNKRETLVSYLEGVRLFKKLDASRSLLSIFHGRLRSLRSHLRISMVAKIRDKFVLRPLFRHYRQNAADFYF